MNMRLDDVDDKLRAATFEYFYWFSRFEFALKANHLLKTNEPGELAEPSWELFIKKYAADYQAPDEANRLIQLHPKRQYVGPNDDLEWKPVGLAHCGSSLCEVVTMLRVVRNNLFHGGKHGDVEVDDKERNLDLLVCSKAVLDHLAQLANFAGDYDGYY